MQQIRAFCGHCDQHVLATKTPFRHGQYVMASMMTFGLVVPLYLFFYWLQSSPYRCTRCGLAVADGRSTATIVSLSIASLFALSVYGSLAIALWWPK